MLAPLDALVLLGFARIEEGDASLVSGSGEVGNTLGTQRVKGSDVPADRAEPGRHVA